MDNSLTSYKIFVIAAFLFFTGSGLGWFIELFYRKFFDINKGYKNFLAKYFHVGLAEIVALTCADISSLWRL